MLLNYKVFNNKRKQQKKPRHFKPAPFAGPRGAALPFIRDEETGGILRVPEYLPSGRRSSPTYGFPRNSGTAEVCEKSHWTPIQKPDLAWLQTQFHLQGVSFLPPPPSPLDLSWSDENAQDLRSFWVWVYPPTSEPGRKFNVRPLLPRTGCVTKRPVSPATGTPDQREEQSAYYLRIFRHDLAFIYEKPEFTLLKVVCNLRNYFGMDLNQTVMLMEELFNLMADMPWSREGISLAWELVADYSPSLGLKDVDAVAKQEVIDLEDEVTALLAYTRSGGRMTTDDFFHLLMEWNPDLKTTKTAVSSAVLDIVGIKKTSSYRDGRSYKGFHLPSAGELLDLAHSAGLDVMSIEVPQHQHQKAARRDFDSLRDFTLLPFTNHMRRCLTRQSGYFVQHDHFPWSSYTLVSLFQVAS